VVPVLVELGARVTVTDGNAERLAELEGLGAELVPGLTEPPEGTVLVVTSPGWRPTSPLLVAAAEAAGTPVREEEATPAELADLPVWAINALHGIRPVTGWAGLAETPPVRPPGRWQRHLDDLSVPLTEGSGTDAHRVHH